MPKLPKFAENQLHTMRVLIQRVRRASVTINTCEHSCIGVGMLVLVGIESADTAQDVDWLVGKIIKLRIFDDEQGVMNLDVRQALGQVLVVSQFTLHASTHKGSRPSYIRAAPPTHALPLYEDFTSRLALALPGCVATGIFGAMMDVELVNDGPVTIWIDSKNKE